MKDVRFIDLLTIVNLYILQIAPETPLHLKVTLPMCKYRYLQMSGSYFRCNIKHIYITEWEGIIELLNNI